MKVSNVYSWKYWYTINFEHLCSDLLWTNIEVCWESAGDA